jgi:steroid delta-isomerase-like uncharacterized protein
MSIEENKAVVRRYYDLWNKHDFDACDDLVAPGFISHRTTGDITKAQMTPGNRMLLSAFPDAVLSVEHLIGEGDLVSFREVCKATHNGPFMGIPPTGKKLDIVNACTLRIKDGKWAEAWTNIDQFNVMQQLGAVPPMGQK